MRGISSSQEIMYHYESKDNQVTNKYRKTVKEAAHILKKLMEDYQSVGVVCWQFECFTYYFTLSLTKPSTVVDYFRWITCKEVLQFLVTTIMSWRFKIKQLIVWGSR